VSARTLGRGAWTRLRIAAARTSATHAGARVADALGAAREAVGGLRASCIVFSKDRPMQLDACLRSIERFAPYKGGVTVLYRATTGEFARGYALVEASCRARLVEQGADFRGAVMELLGSTDEHTVFHTDDDVFFRAPEPVPGLPADTAAFSLRLGENTTYCYTHARPQQLPTFTSEGPFIAWDWTRADADFGYPLSLDGHVFRTEMLTQLLADANFSNPNNLEEELHLRRQRVPPVMLALRRSCVVSIPANVVSESHENRSSADPANSSHALNSRFLDGDRIDLSAMDFSMVRGAHQEISFAFTYAVPRLDGA
jgi:hypothetical protein